MKLLYKPRLFKSRLYLPLLFRGAEPPGPGPACGELRYAGAAAELRHAGAAGRFGSSTPVGKIEPVNCEC